MTLPEITRLQAEILHKGTLQDFGALIHDHHLATLKTLKSETAPGEGMQRRGMKAQSVNISAGYHLKSGLFKTYFWEVENDT